MHHPTQPLHDRRPLLFPSCTLVKLPDSTLTDKNGPSGPSTGKPRLPGRRNVKRYMASNAELCYLAPIMARRSDDHELYTLITRHSSLVTHHSRLVSPTHGHTYMHVLAAPGTRQHDARCSACTCVCLRRTSTGSPCWEASVSSRDHPQHVVCGEDLRQADKLCMVRYWLTSHWSLFTHCLHASQLRGVRQLRVRARRVVDAPSGA